MLGLFRDTLPANVKFPFRDSENLFSHFQLQLSLKVKTFLHFLLPFLESISHSKPFEKKDDPHSYFLTEFKHCERLG